MGFVTGFLRVFSGLLSAAFAIAGIGLVIYGGVSTYLILISNSDMVIKDYGTIVPSGMTFIFGIVLLVFVVMGCCGVCRESTCCMETYAAFLILLAMAHFALGGYCTVVYRNTEQRALRNQIENDLRMKLEDAKLDKIQEWMYCCGIRQPGEEYKYVDPTKLNGLDLPPSCCESRVPCSMDSPDRYMEGCLTSVYNFTIGTNIIIGYISLGIGATEVVVLSEILYGAFCLVLMHLTETADLRLGYSYVSVPPLVLVLSGILLLSLIILGSCGIAKEITCCVHLYSIVLLLLAGLQISIGVLTVYPTVISSEGKSSLEVEINKHLEKQESMNSTTFDNIRSLMRCCGRAFPNDTNLILNKSLPESCCDSHNTWCELNSTSLHQSGCTGVLMDFIVLHNDIVGLVSVSSGLIEISAGIVGFCLGYRLLRDGTTFYAM